MLLNSLTNNRTQTVIPAPLFQKLDSSIVIDSPELGRVLGRFDLYTNNPHRALTHLRSALADAPHDFMTLYYIAQTYEATGDQHSANIAWREIDAGKYLTSQAKKAIKEGRIEYGLARHDLAAELAPNDRDVLYAAGDAYWSHKNLEKAIMYYRQAIVLDDELSFRNHFAAGRIYYVYREWDQAIAEFDQARSLATHMGAPYYWLGMSWYYGKNDVSVAKGYFEQCILVQPNFTGCAIELSKIAVGSP